MENEKIKAAVEAILFAKGVPVSAQEFSAALETGIDKVLEVLTMLEDDYSKPDRGICLLKTNDGYELATKKEHFNTLAALISRDNSYNFTEAMLETLSIVAYKQPITRTAIEQIRGVSCAGQISRLIEYGLIYESGRLDAPGRPFLFSTTDDFLRHFGISSLQQLPDVPSDLVGQMKLELENKDSQDINDEIKEEENNGD